MGSLQTETDKGGDVNHSKEGSWSRQKIYIGLTKEAAGGSPKQNNSGSTKKSRGRIKGKSEEEEEEVDADEDEDEEIDYDEKTQDPDVKEELVTPSRRLPPRRVRITKFVEETSDTEDEQEEEEEDLQASTEVDGMKDLAVKDGD